MLETTDHLVSDIAGMVGFGSSETLRRNFEKYVGTTATDYRRTVRGGHPTAVTALSHSARGFGTNTA